MFWAESSSVTTLTGAPSDMASSIAFSVQIQTLFIVAIVYYLFATGEYYLIGHSWGQLDVSHDV